MKDNHASGPKFEDVIYGHQIKPPYRTATHLARVDGIRHLNRREPAVALAGESVRLIVTTSGGVPIEAVHAWYQVGEAAEAEVSFVRGEVEWDDIAWDYVRRWHADLPPVREGERLTYKIGGRPAGQAAAWIFADSQSSGLDGATTFSVMFDSHSAPAWAADAVIYHIFIDRFSPGLNQSWWPAASLMDFYGGTLRGVIEKLDYLHSMGFNTIWLSPVFASPSHHGYDSTDLLNVEPRFGTNADLDELIREAHGRGIRIILDFVPNHWSNRHPTFLDARRHADSPYRDWYLWKSWPDEYEAYFDVQTMPKLNLHPGSPARRHLLDVARHWLKKGVDGFRLDHAEGPPHDFWADFRRLCLDEKPDAWLFGEIVRPPNLLRTFSGGMHGCLDFALARALRQTFALGNWSFANFEAFLRNHEDYFPGDYSAPAFLDNHDMNRFVFIAEGDENRLKLGALMLYALPGSPVVYYGTERGLSQERSTSSEIGLDEARLPVDWSDDSRSGLRDYFRRLGEARRHIRFDRSLQRRLLALEDARGLYAFSWERNGVPLAAVVLNAGDQAADVELPAGFTGLPRDVLGDRPIGRTGDGRFHMSVLPGSGAFVIGIGDA